MKITYDNDADVLAILLADTDVEETKNIAPGVEVDYDSDGRVLAIEFLGARKKYDLSGPPIEEPDPLFPLAAAGALFGLSPTTLRHQIHRGLLRGVKLGRNWVVHRDDLYRYMEQHSRKAKNRVDMAKRRTGKTKPLSEKNLESVPDQSGVYNLRNQKGEIIYTGTAGAGRLKARLQEHLHGGDVSGARKFQIRPMSSAAEATRVEKALIKRTKPPENRRGK